MSDFDRRVQQEAERIVRDREYARVHYYDFERDHGLTDEQVAGWTAVIIGGVAGAVLTYGFWGAHVAFWAAVIGGILGLIVELCIKCIEER